MIPFSVILEGENAWPDLDNKEVIHLGAGSRGMQVAVLPGGMVSGKPSVAIRIDLPDGRTVVAETSARLFVSAGRMITARYTDLFED